MNWIRGGVVLFLTSAVLQPLRLSAAEAPLSEKESLGYIDRSVAYMTDHHLVKDKASPQFGLLYEYYTPANGKWEEGEGLDTMHDGAWWMEALATIYRSTGDKKYLDWIKSYSIPFYCNILINSDALFTNEANNVVASDTEHEIFIPEKGWCPYWWSDGTAFSIEVVLRNTGVHPYRCWSWYVANHLPNSEFRLNGYALGMSNHMAQDLAMGLQSAWIVTGDPLLAVAARELYFCRLRHKQIMPMVSAAVKAMNPEIDAKVDAWATAWNPNAHYFCLYQNKTWQILAHVDDVFYAYGSSQTGLTPRKIDVSYAQMMIHSGVGYALLEEIWRDGPCLDPSNNSGTWREFNVKFKALQSDTGNAFRYSRMEGNEAFLMAQALELLKAFPTAWEYRYNTTYSTDARVQFVDAEEEPVVDGQPDAVYGPAVNTGSARVQFVSGLRSLYALATVPSGTSIQFRVYATNLTQGAYAEVNVQKNGTVTMKNNSNESCIVTSQVAVQVDGSWVAELNMPYSLAKTQKVWANGVEHGRCAFAMGAYTNNLYFLSTPAHAEKVLNRNLAAIVRFWYAMYDDPKIGYIPEIWRGKLGNVSAYSDSGCNAHLMQALAHYLAYLKGKPDWVTTQEMIRQNKEPEPSLTISHLTGTQGWELARGINDRTKTAS